MPSESYQRGYQCGWRQAPHDEARPCNLLTRVLAETINFNSALGFLVIFLRFEV